MVNIPVVAIKPGYYPSTMRAVGDRFTIASEKDFSENWMRREKPAVPLDKMHAAKGPIHTSRSKES